MWVREPGWSTDPCRTGAAASYVPLSTRREWESPYQTGFAKMRQLACHHSGWRLSVRLAYVEKSDPLFVASLEMARKWLLVGGYYYLS